MVCYATSWNGSVVLFKVTLLVLLEPSICFDSAPRINNNLTAAYLCCEHLLWFCCYIWYASWKKCTENVLWPWNWAVSHYRLYCVKAKTSHIPIILGVLTTPCIHIPCGFTVQSTIVTYLTQQICYQGKLHDTTACLM